MLFNTLEFAVFLPLVFVLYWFVLKNNFQHQNALIVMASYIFYGWWDYRFLTLIAFSTILDFFLAKKMPQVKALSRKYLLWISLAVNLGFLGFFKYYNFFVDSFVNAFSIFGTNISANTLNIILPVGISFYTFQTLSYTIDVYKGKLEPSNSIINFSAYVSFFPQLVAGPIERATHLLPQFAKERTFNYANAVIGMRQILWGLFKKMVIADNCAYFANEIFNNSDELSGLSLVAGALFFTFQIYGDFSGYSDIAIGTARLFGFNLMRNFAYPYFSRDIAEFWRRWHISLSTWFRDYLYIPLGGSSGGASAKVRNTFIIFIVSGFWHGANWTFVFWGFLNALYFLPLLITKRNRVNVDEIALGKRLPGLREFGSMVFTFLLTVFAWIFFRAESITHAFRYVYNMITKWDLAKLDFLKTNTERLDLLHLVFMIVFMLVLEWNARFEQFALERKNIPPNKALRIAFYLILTWLIIYLKGGGQEFIYFAF
jgi:alginate O-acetyltransferase complex protein AlgI